MPLSHKESTQDKSCPSKTQGKRMAAQLTDCLDEYQGLVESMTLAYFLGF